MSLLSWERGLKYLTNYQSANQLVAPLVGAWIEIILNSSFSTVSKVAPLVGAWIEISLRVSFQARPFVAPLVGAWIEIE